MRKIILLSSAVLLSMSVGFSQSIELTPDGYTGNQNSSGSATPSLRLLHPLSNGFSRINFENEGVTNKFMISGNVKDVAADSRWNVWHTSTGNVISATGDGNVGVGVSSPSERFHVKGGDVLFEDTTPFLEFRNTGDAGATGINFGTSTGSLRAQIKYTPTSSSEGVVQILEGTGSNNGLFLIDGPGTANSGNNIGINEDEPRGRLHVRSNSQPTNPSILIEENNNSTVDAMDFENSSSTMKWSMKYQANDTPANAHLTFESSTTGDVLKMTGDGNIVHDGFTQLGDTAPKVKMKKITGTMDNDSQTAVSHGLNRDKILAVDVHVSNGAGVNYPPSGNGLQPVDRQYRYWINSVFIFLDSVGADLQGQSYWMLITYEE